VIVDSLLNKFSDFRRAYDEGGLRPDEFDSYGPTRRTLRQFITACRELDALVMDYMVPNPD
jgi:transaldolase